MNASPTPLESIKNAALALVKSDSDATTLQAVATILKYASESEKTLVETRNLTRSTTNEAWRFFVPVIAPLVSAIAVVAALVFQTVQFRETSRLQERTVEIQQKTAEFQAKSAEDSSWREDLRTLTQSPNVMSGVTGTTLLSAYLSSGSHVEEARSIAFTLLGGLNSFNVFSPLFANAMKATPSEKHLEVLANLGSTLRETFYIFVSESQQLDPPPTADLPNYTDQHGKVNLNPVFAQDQVSRQLQLVCETVASTLRASNKPPPSSQTRDLTLWDCDMSDVNFSTLGLIKANIQGVSVAGADLGKITEYENSVWTNTAWWRAKRIEKGLLKYLKENYPFSTKGVYYTAETKRDYDVSLSRLADQR